MNWVVDVDLLREGEQDANTERLSGKSVELYRGSEDYVLTVVPALYLAVLSRVPLRKSVSERRAVQSEFERLTYELIVLLFFISEQATESKRKGIYYTKRAVSDSINLA